MCNITFPNIDFAPVYTKFPTFEEAISNIINRCEGEMLSGMVLDRIRSEINIINKIYNKNLSVNYENNIVNFSGFDNIYKFNEFIKRVVLTEKV